MKMINQTYSIQEVNPYRYKVFVNTGVSHHDLCEIANYESIDKWYLVKESLNYELSEDALKFIYESVKNLNNQ
jgi:hypothetical protein